MQLNWKTKSAIVQMRCYVGQRPHRSALPLLGVVLLPPTYSKVHSCHLFKALWHITPRYLRRAGIVALLPNNNNKCPALQMVENLFVHQPFANTNVLCLYFAKLRSFTKN